jgi:hypothetical protein
VGLAPLDPPYSVAGPRHPRIFSPAFRASITMEVVDCFTTS